MPLERPHEGGDRTPRLPEGISAEYLDHFGLEQPQQSECEPEYEVVEDVDEFEIGGFGEKVPAMEQAKPEATASEHRRPTQTMGKIHIPEYLRNKDEPEIAPPETTPLIGQEVVRRTETTLEKPGLDRVVPGAPGREMARQLRTVYVVATRNREIDPRDKPGLLEGEVDLGLVRAIGMLSQPREALPPPGTQLDGDDLTSGERFRERLSNLRNVGGGIKGKVDGFLEYRERRRTAGFKKLHRIHVPDEKKLDLSELANTIRTGSQIDAAALRKEQEARIARLLAEDEMMEEILTKGTSETILTFATNTEIPEEVLRAWTPEVRDQVIGDLARKIAESASKLTPKKPVELARIRALHERLLAMKYSSEDPVQRRLNEDAQREFRRKGEFASAEKTILVMTGGRMDNPGILPALAVQQNLGHEMIITEGQPYQEDTRRVLQEQLGVLIHPATPMLPRDVQADIVFAQGGTDVHPLDFLDRIRPDGIGLIAAEAGFEELAQGISVELHDPESPYYGQFAVEEIPSGLLRIEQAERGFIPVVEERPNSRALVLIRQPATRQGNFT